MTKTARMETGLTIQRYKATSSFGGIAESVQRARYTVGRLRQAHEPLAADALFVLVLRKMFVSAIHWKLFVLILLPTLTLKQTVLVLLKSQVQHTQSIAGCQMRLALKNDL